MLEDVIKKDLVDAMKKQDKIKMATLRGVKSAYQLEQINKGTKPSDDLMYTIIGREIKMREDSIKEFKNAGRDDLVNSYSLEIDILKKYMPEQISEEELNKIVTEAISKTEASSIKDLGKIMKEIMPTVKNKCDMNLLNQIIRTKLV